MESVTRPNKNVFQSFTERRHEDDDTDDASVHHHVIATSAKCQGMATALSGMPPFFLRRYLVSFAHLT